MQNRNAPIDREEAELVGVRALQFVASDPQLLGRFLALSGLEADQLRARVREPGFFAGLLDFLLNHEPTLLAFSADAAIDPQVVRRARAALADGYGVTED
ncbi:DUF3572 domain-containing protein [Consotaella aegiceratis]|uniref:DUF3572 domain-containing protein n=1 Tax=Consotaella aegiceratis TaxID=3097961 RepID=UPI002F427FFF